MQMGGLGPGPASTSLVKSSYEPERCVCDPRTHVGASAAFRLWGVLEECPGTADVASGLKA